MLERSVALEWTDALAFHRWAELVAIVTFGPVSGGRAIPVANGRRLFGLTHTCLNHSATRPTEALRAQ